MAKVGADGTGLVYAGYIGGDGTEEGRGIAVDTAGNAYITGYTGSELSFPVTVGPDLTMNGGSDAFVAKVTEDGTGLVYAGFLGGDGGVRSFEVGAAIAVDASGSAYVTGLTDSTASTFPIAVGPDLAYNGGQDAFVAKVKTDGTGLDYAGYIGGSSLDVPMGIAVDAARSAYVTGYTRSTEVTFPVIVGPDLTHNGGSASLPDDAFVAKIRRDGSGFVYAGYVGGNDFDSAGGIAVDSAGSAYVTGATVSTEGTFPVTVGPDLTYNGGADAFVAKVRADGTGLDYAGYIGGEGSDAGTGIAVDVAGSTYISGQTSSTEGTFPIALGPDLTHNGDSDAFVAKLQADGTGLVYAGYIGGSHDEGALGIAVDGCGNAYVTGVTSSASATFPVVVGPDLTVNGDYEAFVAKVSDFACLASAEPIQRLLVVRQPSTPDDIDFVWLPDIAATGYNVWYVTRKQDIDLARQASAPPAIPIAGCAVPSPATGPACTDLGAVSRDTSKPFFYQVRAYCCPTVEGHSGHARSTPHSGATLPR